MTNTERTNEERRFTHSVALDGIFAVVLVVAEQLWADWRRCTSNAEVSQVLLPLSDLTRREVSEINVQSIENAFRRRSNAKSNGARERPVFHREKNEIVCVSVSINDFPNNHNSRMTSHYYSRCYREDSERCPFGKLTFAHRFVSARRDDSSLS